MTSRDFIEPACRVCNCNEHNACGEGCSWVKVEKNSLPLCSACSGTAGDLLEAMKRVRSILLKFSFSADPTHTVDVMKRIAQAAIERRNARAKAEANVYDASWGSR